MLPKTHQQAWINGLPNMVMEGGIPLEVLPFPSPKSDTRTLTLTLFASKDVVSQIQLLSKNQTKIPKLGLVVRTDPVKENDSQYLMSYAVIETVKLAADSSGACTVNILFQSITMTKGVSMNPGPPANHQVIQRTGVNTGWVFGLQHEKFENGKPIDVLDFAPPQYNRCLNVTLGKPSKEIDALVQSPLPVQELILVLPDRSSQRYVEYKLRDVKTFVLEDEQHVTFESDMIECITGKDG